MKSEILKRHPEQRKPNQHIFKQGFKNGDEESATWLGGQKHATSVLSGLSTKRNL